MDAKAYNAALGELRQVRDKIKKDEAALRKLQAALAKQTADRDSKIQTLGAYAKATAAKIAPAAGVSVADVVALVPELGPQQPTAAQPEPGVQSPAAIAAEVDETAIPVPRQDSERPLTRPGTQNLANSAVGDRKAPQTASEAVPAAPLLEQPAEPAPPVGAEQPTEPVADHDEGVVPSPAAAPLPQAEETERQLPSIPAGPDGDRWFAVTPNLLSTRPNFTQQARQMAFLDAATGVLVYRNESVRLDLGQASVAEILTAVYATVPEGVERIYITAGDPWHCNADRHPFLRDAVAEWLTGPLPDGWKVESSRGRDRLAGHLIHERNPVGRWQRGRDQHVEIRSVGEWFDTDGADPATVRDAFVLLWKALRQHWNDVVIMGSPSQTGRDLWSRTIPAKAGSRWADGYPVMSEEIRGLLHATAGQGRTELIAPPRIAEELPRWTELDRTFAYAKHTWQSGVGAPQRITGQRFAAMSQKEQADALFAPSHWQVRVTVPTGWEHVGLLPAPDSGERSWHYPNEGGRTFVTWAGGPEVNLALRNPVAPWTIEILDGLLWQKGDPLKGWANKLKEAWANLRALSAHHGEEQQRTAARLASRAVRAILLYGIGTFAQRPKPTTGSVELDRSGQVPDGAVPEGARITGLSDTHVHWQRNAGFSRDPFAHPEWSAGVWSMARAALLSAPISATDPATGKAQMAGALHLPAGSIVGFRTDSIATTADVNWPYGGQPGDWLVKGRLPWPQKAPTAWEEYYDLQRLGRQALEAGES
ncbi:Mucin-19 [Streptomyces sp. NPDC021100]|uniref:Mucin-19 n=1 Tax=Streptomyces sp. NPDC021100 TaxID=3365114 RepID=UPI003796E4A0